MAYSLPTLDSPEDEKEFSVSHIRLPSPPQLTNVFNTSGYEHLDLGNNGDDDSIQEGANSPQDTINSLGIFPDQKARAVRVRRVSGVDKSPDVTSASEVASPDSGRGLLDSPASSSGRSPGGSPWAGNRSTSIFQRLMSKNGNDEKASLRENARPFSYSPAPNTPMGILNNSPSTDAEPGQEYSDTETFNKRFGAPPTYCRAKTDIWKKSKDLLMIVTAVYSLVMGSILFAISIRQPPVSAIGLVGGVKASTAGSFVSLVGKTVEITFAAAFVFCLGQALSRRSVSRMTKGVTLSEMNMKDWINSPGTIALQYKSTWFSIRSLLGLLTFVATLGVLFYTTAINTMVVPKLKKMPIESTTLKGEVYTSYGNMPYGMTKCPILFGKNDPDGKDGWGCTSIEFCGQSYTDLLGFMQRWLDFKKLAVSQPLAQRPTPSSLLNGNKTMETSWIETEHRNVTTNFHKYGRIIDNVTMAMPHPGVFSAAELPRNNMPRVQDGFVGEVAINASVVSPTVNVMCVNLKKEEIAPLVYMSWPNSRKDHSKVKGYVVPADGWLADYPPWGEVGKKGNVPNKTVVDDIFKWGPKYGRTPPILSTFPPAMNMVSNMSVKGSGGVYILIKSLDIEDYTLCEARSWLSDVCSTQILISGTHGASLKAICEDPDDKTAYNRIYPTSKGPATPELGWTDVAANWSTSMDVNGGLRVNNGSNARILSQLILKEPKIDSYFPTIAEALSAYLASTVVMSAIDSPFHHGWDYPTKMLDAAATQEFKVRQQTTQYAAGHTETWQQVWYIILSIVPALSLFCLLYMLLNGGVITDFTEPKTLFTLALNSPPSAQIHGSCGSGPEGRDLVVPWRVSYEPELHHYFFEEANNKPWRGKYSRQELHIPGPGEDYIGANYNRLSASRLKL
ncbi:hypothetical protein J3459_014669 [Metarhizium acridum]|uniref:uncharacterized protein n=1 Tax=Metarhizium acridum TaxID=92637 RepID=UPI001C6C2FCF|nr:hypothetical protein J3458_014354 [Metarhizium acridum]KAG8414509.1 hypothetical protein J3459_014669 [Metarhizium acridum]